MSALDSSTIVPSSTNGLLVYHLYSANTTNATIIKQSNCQLYGWAINNTSASFKYICFHDTVSVPTAGAGILWKYGVPATGGTNQLSLGFGIQFNTGLAITTVANAIDSDATAVAAGDLVINLFFK